MHCWGVGLNSVANYKLFNELELDDIFIFPAASDSGISAGAALWAYANQGGHKRPEMTRATLGCAYGSDHVNQAAQLFGDHIEVEVLSDVEMLTRSAQALAKGNIVARYEGGCEYGPRALGHRSIMADPTFERMRDIINARVKFRESFRPFAPVIPLENVDEVFELEIQSPFMLMVAPIRPELREQIPAVTHVDGTGRIQTVTHADNAYFYQLCYQLVKERQGPPVLLNTSFNVAGQPIVETPEEAIQTFLNTDIDYLALENLWISKRQVAVQDYDAHLSKISDATTPEGLPPNQPAVTALMAKLDRALFYEDCKDCPWTTAELKQLSAVGARYKETSQLFPDMPIVGGLQTKLSQDVVLLLDPLNRSALVDLSEESASVEMKSNAQEAVRFALKSRHGNGIDSDGLSTAMRLTSKIKGKVPKQLLFRSTATTYSFDDVKLLLALLSGQPDWREQIRLELQLTHAELAQQIDWAKEQLARYNIEVDSKAASAGKCDDVLLQPELEQTLAPFADCKITDTSAPE